MTASCAERCRSYSGPAQSLSVTVGFQRLTLCVVSSVPFVFVVGQRPLTLTLSAAQPLPFCVMQDV